MKKLLAILLTVCMVLSLAACGGDSGSDATNPGGSSNPTQGNQGGDSKDPATQPTTQNDPQEGHDPDDSGNEGNDPDDEDETTEPTQAGTDLSDVPNPLGLNSLILAAYLNNAGTWNYEAGETTPCEFTQEMWEGIRTIEFSHQDWEETSTLSVGTYYVANKATAASEDEYEYKYSDISCKVDFVPELTGSDLDAIWEDLNTVSNLERFTTYIVNIDSLEGLADHPNLDWVRISHSDTLTSLQGLEGHDKLEWIYCESCPNMSDISALASCTALKRAYLTDCNISDLTPLANLTTLEELRLYNNPITNIAPLSNLPNLVELNFMGTQVAELPTGGTTRVQSISYPNGMTGLGNLSQWVADGANLHLTMMDDISLAGFENFTYLKTLNLAGSKITNDDLAYLKNVAIDVLILSGTVTDLSGLDGNTGLKEINLSGAQVSDLSPLAGCTSLKAIYAEGTLVTDVSCLENLESLTTLTLSSTPMTDVSSVTKIPNLKTLYLNYKEDLTDVSPLVNCPSLQYLYLARCTNIKDISALAASTTLKMINSYGIEGLDTSAFDGTEIEIREYY